MSERRIDIVVADKVHRELDVARRARGLTARQAAAREFAREVEEGRANYGGMLARVWKEALRTLEEVEADPDLSAKDRMAALKDIARLLPTLAKAEATHVARVGGVAVEDMSDRQLERELGSIRRRRAKKVNRDG